MWTARRLGELGYIIAFRHRQNTISHLDNAFGRGKTRAEIHSIARGVFRHMAQTGAEMLRFPKMTAGEIKKIVDGGDVYQRCRAIMKEGKGLITLTSHIGNWELLGGLASFEGFQSKAIARKLRYPRFHAWVESLRRSIGVDLIYRDASPKTIIRWLRSGHMLGILPDQDIDSLSGVFVDFFGRAAYTSVAPVKLSLMTGAPIATVFLLREPGDRYRLVLDDVIRPSVETSQEEAIQKYTTMWMKSCEKIIRQHPEQWGWMHNRWKTQQQESHG